jgi:hypothetical protein
VGAASPVGAVGSTAAWPPSSSFLVKLTLASRHCKQYVTTLWPWLCLSRGVGVGEGCGRAPVLKLLTVRLSRRNARLCGSGRAMQSTFVLIPYCMNMQILVWAANTER